MYFLENLTGETKLANSLAPLGLMAGLVSIRKAIGTDSHSLVAMEDPRF